MKKTAKKSNKPQPVDMIYTIKLKQECIRKFSHSAYRSGVVVQQYKMHLLVNMQKKALLGKRTMKRGLSRWFEKWVNQRGKVGYKYKSDIYRPTYRITSKTPTTHGELSKKQIKRARKEKYTKVV